MPAVHVPESIKAEGLKPKGMVQAVVLVTTVQVYVQSHPEIFNGLKGLLRAVF